jgi:CHAT domain-containing protein
MAVTTPEQGTMAVDFDASRERIMSEDLQHYRIVHFATHGILDRENPDASGLILSLVDRDGNPQNGYLPLRDIYRMDMRAELVVLSACRTGLGRSVEGEGLIGLTRGFIYSKSVVASLWKVEDEATAELMKAFYTSLLRDGLPPAAALRSAKQVVRRQDRWRSPYYWAGFVLQGEYSETFVSSRTASHRSPVVPLIAALLVLSGLLLLSWRRRRLEWH